MPPSASGSIETLQQVTIRLKGSDNDIVFANLSLQERMLSTGHFSFVWKNDFNDNYADDQEQFIQDTIGKEIIITFEDHHTFKGIILEIHFFRNDGLTQEFNISGQGLGVKLQDQMQSASYYKKDIKTIIDDALQGIPSNAISIDNAPKNTQEQFYVVQYQETDFAFLSHLAIRFGEWFYYNGEQLVFGKLNTDALSLQAESDVYSASLSSQLSPMHINARAYDNFQGETMSHQSESPSSNGLLQVLGDASGTVYEREPVKVLHLNQAATPEILSDRVNMEVQSRTSRMILYSAKSRNSQIKLGRVIKIVSGNKSSEYIVVSVTHSSSAHQSYQNEFIAIPKSVTVPQYTDPNWFPKAETHSGKITDNEDPDGHDRMKVHLPWQQDGEKTPWIRMQNPYAGKDKGFRFIPEVGEEVLVGFEHNNAEKPFVLGAMYNAAAKSGHNHDGNNVKVLRTRSGNRIILDDDSGSVKIYDKSGSYVKLLGNGDIEIVAGGNFKLQAGKNITIEAAENLDITVGQKMTTTVGQDFGLTASSKIETTSGADTKLTAGANMECTAGANGSITAGANFDLTAGAQLNATAGAQLKLTSPASELSGTGTVDVKGASATVSGDVLTTVKGAIVMIN